MAMSSVVDKCHIHPYWSIYGHHGISYLKTAFLCHGCDQALQRKRQKTTVINTTLKSLEGEIHFNPFCSLRPLPFNRLRFNNTWWWRVPGSPFGSFSPPGSPFSCISWHSHRTWLLMCCRSLLSTLGLLLQGQFIATSSL